MKTKFKKWYPQLLTLASAITIMGDNVFAQATLEFSSGAGPTGNGPSIAPQVITFQNNTNNPTGNTFATYTPKTTVTFSLSNQQYTHSVAESSTATALMFGAANANTTPAVTPYAYYNLPNAYSSSVNGDYTSASTVPVGTGTIKQKGLLERAALFVLWSCAF